MRIPLPKLKAVIRYFGTYTDSKFLGKVKLMKLFYFLDFGYVKKFGAPITYDTYVNLEHGPIPSAIKNLVDSADDDIDNSVLADTIMIERPEGIDMHRIIPLKKFTKSDETYFSETELEMLNKICIRFGNKNTKQIEEESHKEAPWRETKMFDTIPYSLASKDSDCLVSEGDIKFWMDAIA